MTLEVKDAGGATRELSATTDVNNEFSVIQTTKDMCLAVNMGLVDGYEYLDKFGENPDVGTSAAEDIWEGGGEYTFDTFGTAPIVSIASDNAADTVDIEVQGLDINGDLVKQTVTLTGTTRVALTTALWRVFRMSNESSTDIVGTVFCYTGTGAVPSVAPRGPCLSG